MENILEDIEVGELEFELAEEFLVELKRVFSGEDNKLAKVVELKKVEQESWLMEEFVQKFKGKYKSSSYEDQALIEEFK